MKKKATNKKLIPVTDHALVRYFERIEGRDIEKIKRQINNPDLLKWVATLGDGDYPVQNEYYARVHKGVVVTILEV